MFKAFSNMLILVMVLASFLGQAMTTSIAMPCETLTEPHASNVHAQESTNDSTTTIHSNNVSSNKLDLNDTDLNNVSSETADECCDIESCDISCMCIASACSSVAFVNTAFTAVKAVVLSESVYTQPFKQPKSVSTLLYRPPIFIS